MLIHFVSHKRDQGKHKSKQRNSSRIYEHNDLKNNAHIHNPQIFPAKQTGQHDDVHFEDFDPFEEFDPCEEFGQYEDLDPYEEFGPDEEFDLGFLFFIGGVMMTFT